MVTGGRRRILPMGERAVLVELDGLDGVLALAAALAASPLAGIDEVVPAARTLLVRYDPARVGQARVRAWVADAAPAPASLPTASTCPTGAAPEPAAPEPSASATRSAARSTVVESAPDDVVLDVIYDGPDLASAAAALGLSADELAERHSRARWRVAFTGFAPGFGYLVSDDWPYEIPRLDAPRPRVLPGSVGLAGAFSGAYPRETPGGWRLIGTTSATLFDPASADPVLLSPGTSVRFRAVTRSSRVTCSAGPPAVPRVSDEAPPADPALELCAARASGERDDSGAPGGSSASESPRSAEAHVESRAPDRSSIRVAPGSPEAPPRTAGRAGTSGATPLAPDAARVTGSAPGAFRVERAGAATVQDLGRPGRGRLGIARSGSLDRGALRLANRLVGNAEDAAAIEVALGGLAARAHRDLWIAITGAWGPIRLAGRPVDSYTAVRWPAGEVLEIGWLTHGARAVLAVRGGIEASASVGSRSTDTLAGLGPAALRAGDELPVGAEPAAPVPSLDIAPWGWPPDPVEVDLMPGPRADWFAASAHRALFDADWTVSAQADRIGMRLDGPMLDRIRPGELPSEGMVPGALQVPPSGRPAVLLADGPVTGGYPVIAVVTDAALDRLAQAAPGARLRFRRALR
ncbi:5-oxoprolinase/urea amidolyase family protein [Microbacterium sp. 18062]|uniref:5-oxoprolinase/urea amidolyase family protein n=1 Tax=Microbacterium sp. 18062 TaxID=2681410 RepID=UPI001F34F00C|nr:5-oxoprolinase/urea amidolyase family protein [Microbacterium sp. 18062]